MFTSCESKKSADTEKIEPNCQDPDFDNQEFGLKLCISPNWQIVPKSEYPNMVQQAEENIEIEGGYLPKEENRTQRVSTELLLSITPDGEFGSLPTISIAATPIDNRSKVKTASERLEQTNAQMEQLLGNTKFKFSAITPMNIGGRQFMQRTVEIIWSNEESSFQLTYVTVMNNHFISLIVDYSDPNQLDEIVEQVEKLNIN